MAALSRKIQHHHAQVEIVNTHIYSTTESARINYQKNFGSHSHVMRHPTKQLGCRICYDKQE